ncbi:hypothetical protein MRB53_001893 [Persea americana]|uniref:Uncharacterized protein n=1 Tax=Persea americana TaxID=3435 RepID=A0ACC2MT92_PERAE|nr:hypothetical protein MRB53_001893 [Persea americana]
MENEKYLDSTRQSATIDGDIWVDLDERAVSSIQQYLFDEVKFNVMEEETAKDLREKLYMEKTLTNKLHLKKQLYGLDMEEGCDVLEHINTFNRMIGDLLRLSYESFN